MSIVMVALYESMGDAGQVRRELEAAGIPSSDIDVSNRSGQRIAGTRSTVTEPRERESGGFLDWLFGGPEEHATAYRESIERGNTLVSVCASEAQRERVSAILERYDPIDIEERGGVRVRNYVVERPVEHDVRLRDETIRVERRSTAASTQATSDAFKERSIEVSERDEEAVVSKAARVKEEVVVGKDVGQHTERVKDTVREVEVEPAVAGPTDRNRR